MGENQFKSLGINFSLITRSSCLFDLNYKVKLKQIDGILNCWRARNLSMIGKNLCDQSSPFASTFVSIFCFMYKNPHIFFKELDKMFYKLIWNGGNDRVKRVHVRNHFNHCGLRMIDTYNFSLAQKMTWVKLLFYNRYDSFWKTIELSDMDHHYGDLLWNSYDLESLLNNLNSSQLADSLRTWYVYRERACQEIYGTSFSDFGYLH